VGEGVMERLEMKVSKNRRYVIPKNHQDKYGFKPGKNIVFKADGKNRVVGRVF